MDCASALTGPELGELLRKGHSSDPWYGPATVECLATVTFSAAATRSYANAHTIWEIVLHMTAWQREVARRLSGLPPQAPADGDWPTPPPPTEQAWASAQADLRHTLESLATLVTHLSAEELQKPVGLTRDRALGSGVSTAQMVAGILQHNAYHSGQIALLAKSSR